MDSLFQIMQTIRTEILEKFTIPGLGISYWKFCIYLLIIGVVVTVLVNGVRVSGGALSADNRIKDREEQRIARSKSRKGKGG